jgi:carbon-monoxide dehydrogenase small subunit
MGNEISIVLNGEEVSLKVEPHWTLLRVIRQELGFTGTKEGCGKGQCGSCTVLLDGEAVNACLLLAVDADHKAVTTIEGLANGEELHPLQIAFMENGAIQCGYCTPGMILAAKAFLDKRPSPSEQEIRFALAGNLCRCTGYAKIIDAIQIAAEGMRGGE